VLKAWCWFSQRWNGHTSAPAILFAALAIALGVVVLVQAVMLHARGWRIALGTLPEWFSAFGTIAAIAAVLVATLGYRHEVRSRTQDEELRREAARRQQAELLSGWLINHGGTRPGDR
jgi:hypothetical protein